MKTSTSQKNCSTNPKPRTPCWKSKSARSAAKKTGTAPKSMTNCIPRPRKASTVAQRLGLGERGRYMAAFTFGNVHGAYKPGVVKLRPELLDEIQTTVALAIKAGEMPAPAHSLDVAPGKPFALVFHGGSGSAPEEIAQAVSYGVVKMNIDTDTQYAFSRAVAGHMFSNYDSVLKIDGEVGNKKLYDPRSWGREAESAMAARVVEACKQLGSAGRALN